MTIIHVFVVNEQIVDLGKRSIRMESMPDDGILHVVVLVLSSVKRRICKRKGVSLIH